MRTFISVFILIIQGCFVLWPASAHDAKEDSLHQLMHALPADSQLYQLDAWIRENMQNANIKTYLNLLNNEAEQQQNEIYQASALFLLAQYYYSYNPDSMRYYIDLAEPLLKQQNRYEELFKLKGWDAFSLITEGKRNRVLTKIAEMSDLADQLNFSAGKDMANQALANFYINSGLNEEGLALYEEILHNMEVQQSPLVKRVYILRQLLNRETNIEKRQRYLEKLELYILECEEKSITQLDYVNSLDFLKYLYHRSYVLLAYEKKDVSKMLYHLQRAERLNNQFLWEKDRSTTMLLWLYY